MIENKTRILIAVAVALGLSLVNHGCGDDPVKPGEPPRITKFTVTPGDIMPGDSSLVEYAVTGADSVKLQPDGVKLTPASAGERWVKPPRPTVYSLLGYNKDGKDSAAVTISMSGAVPQITSLDLTEDTILIGDSTVLLWQTVRADSIVMNSGLGRMVSTDSGGIQVKPSANTTYRAIAHNHIGTDTAVVTARVEVPYTVGAIFGFHFKGVMGGGIQQPEFRFRVLDQAGAALRKPWVHFSIVEGDGSLSIDSARPDAGGSILNNYLFDGLLGYGVVRALVRDVDTTDVKVRASVIRFGADGQGQYVKLWDTYADVFALNGQPVSIDHPETDKPYYYINYEQALGVVPIVYDVSGDGIVQNAEPVFEVILTTAFTGTSAEAIGIGSSIQAVRAAYGPPDSTFYSPPSPPNNPAAEGLKYVSLGALFYAAYAPPDSAIIEIHLWDPTPPSPSGTVSKGFEIAPAGRALGIRFSRPK